MLKERKWFVLYLAGEGTFILQFRSFEDLQFLDLWKSNDSNAKRRTRKIKMRDENKKNKLFAFFIILIFLPLFQNPILVSFFFFLFLNFTFPLWWIFFHFIFSFLFCWIGAGKQETLLCNIIVFKYTGIHFGLLLVCVFYETIHFWKGKIKYYFLFFVWSIICLCGVKSLCVHIELDD